MKFLCVYLGSAATNDKNFKDSVVLLGKEIVALGFTLVYGGSSLGMMGLLASTVQKNGGKVIGVMARQLLEKEKPLETLDEFLIVDSMQERKKLLQQKADMFLVMPGGIGTLEEVFETWNAIKIGIFDKPIGFLNVNGYFDGLFAFINTCEKNGFLSSSHAQIPMVSQKLRPLLNKMSEYYYEDHAYKQENSLGIT